MGAMARNQGSSDRYFQDANDGAEEEQADPQAAVNQQAADALN